MNESRLPAVVAKPLTQLRDGRRQGRFADEPLGPHPIEKLRLAEYCARTLGQRHEKVHDLWPDAVWSAVAPQETGRGLDPDRVDPERATTLRFVHQEELAYHRLLPGAP